MFDTVLVANRGEIALRVLRSARALGLRTVAVYSDADSAAPHVRAADTALRIGPAPAVESYLSIPALLDAARRSGAQDAEGDLPAVRDEHGVEHHMRKTP